MKGKKCIECDKKIEKGIATWCSFKCEIKWKAKQKKCHKCNKKIERSDWIKYYGNNAFALCWKCYHARL